MVTATIFRLTKADTAPRVIFVLLDSTLKLLDTVWKIQRRKELERRKELVVKKVSKLEFLNTLEKPHQIQKNAGRVKDE